MTTNAVEMCRDEMQRRKEFTQVNYWTEAFRFIAMLGAIGALILLLIVAS